MKTLKDLVCLMICGMLLVTGMGVCKAQSEVYTGIVRKIQISFCMDACGRYTLDPDPGYSHTNLSGNLEPYVNQHVWVSGTRIYCVECGALAVSQIYTFPPVTDISDFPTEQSGQKFFLQNYPNPFNLVTDFNFTLPDRSFVSLKIVDVTGKEVATVISEELSPGTYSLKWNAGELPGGTYFYRLQAGSFSETKQLILIR